MLLIVSTPILVLFSPILVPAVAVIVVVAAGLLLSGSCAAAAVAAVWGMYRYVTREKIAERPGKEYGQSVERKAEETTNK